MSDVNGRVAVIGAGPYGLAAAARLRSAGVDTHVFGDAMSFWREHMPAGMLLRSSWDASNIGDLHGPLTLEAYQQDEGTRLRRPIPLESFVCYGEWLQRQAVPDLDRRRVCEVRRDNGSFALRLSDGETVRARRVVVAVGLAGFPVRPSVFAGLGPEQASHAVDHRDLRCFGGCRVAVIGSGQSALESAALLSEAGAEVEVIARAPQIRWLSRSAKLHRLPTRAQHLLYAPTDVGPPGLSWLVARPEVFRRLPQRLQGPIAYRSIRPAGAGWLVSRLSGVPISTGVGVLAIYAAGDQVRLRLSDGGEREVDHVLLATGYKVDVRKYSFIAPELIDAMRQDDGYPLLGAGFESSVPGLHIIGAAAARSFGPVTRFVSGTWYTVDALARRIAGADAT